jgi:hypothetical protein
LQSRESNWASPRRGSCPSPWKTSAGRPRSQLALDVDDNGGGDDNDDGNGDDDGDVVCGDGDADIDGDDNGDGNDNHTGDDNGDGNSDDKCLPLSHHSGLPTAQ